MAIATLAAALGLALLVMSQLLATPLKQGSYAVRPACRRARHSRATRDVSYALGMTTVKAVAVSLVVFTALMVLLAWVGNAGAGELLLVLVVAAIAGFAYRRKTTAVR